MVEDDFVGFASSYQCDLSNQEDVQVSYFQLTHSFTGTNKRRHEIFLKKRSESLQTIGAEELQHEAQGCKDAAEA